MARRDDDDTGRRNLPVLRLVVQSGFLVFCLWMGYRFFLFYQWAVGASDRFVPRPPSVEGFLPISGLLGLKKLMLTGRWDSIHPAGLTILLTAIVIGLVWRKGFCGWICPVGAVSNLAERAGRRMGILLSPPRWLDLPLLAGKYLLLAFFLYVIFWKMDLGQVIGFMRTPYNIAADAKMLHFFLQPSTLAATILAVLVVVSFVIRNFWCRYLCPYGALLGLLALVGPVAVRRDEEACIHCSKCDRVCPTAVRVSTKEVVRSAECIGCLECVAACPRRDCLTVTAPTRRRLPWWGLPVAVLATFFAAYLVAVATGHWQTSVPLDTFKAVYRASSGLSHPSF